MIKFLRVFLCFLVGALVVGAPSESYAKRLKKLDESAVRSFISTTNKVTSGTSQFKKTEQVAAYLKKHIHDEARFISSMKFIIPGFPPQENLMNLGKDDFMDSVKQGAEDVEKYNNDIEILDIQFSNNAKKATVKTRSVEHGLMDTGTGEQVEIEGTSECTQLLGISRRGHIQMENATCTTEIKFLEL